MKIARRAGSEPRRCSSATAYAGVEKSAVQRQLRRRRLGRADGAPAPPLRAPGRLPRHRPGQRPHRQRRHGAPVGERPMNARSRWPLAVGGLVIVRRDARFAAARKRGLRARDIFGPIGLASAGTLGAGQLQQAEYAHDSVICSDGSYVVFDGSVGGVSRGLAGEPRHQADAAGGGRGRAAALGERGRPLRELHDQPDRSRARRRHSRARRRTARQRSSPGRRARRTSYVRDMDLAPGEAGAFTVASARRRVRANRSPTREAGSELGSVAQRRLRDQRRWPARSRS